MVLEVHELLASEPCSTGIAQSCKSLSWGYFYEREKRIKIKAQILLTQPTNVPSAAWISICQNSFTTFSWQVVEF